MRRTVAGLLEASFSHKLLEKRLWSYELGRGVWGARVGGRTRRLLGFDCHSLRQISPSQTVWEMGVGKPFPPGDGAAAVPAARRSLPVAPSTPRWSSVRDANSGRVAIFDAL